MLLRVSNVEVLVGILDAKPLIQSSCLNSYPESWSLPYDNPACAYLCLPCKIDRHMGLVYYIFHQFGRQETARNMRGFPFYIRHITPIFTYPICESFHNIYTSRERQWAPRSKEAKERRRLSQWKITELYTESAYMYRRRVHYIRSHLLSTLLDYATCGRSTQRGTKHTVVGNNPGLEPGCWLETNSGPDRSPCAMECNVMMLRVHYMDL